MKYLVMEIHPGYAVVLDEEGRFIKAANLHYEIGQKVTDIIEMQVSNTSPRRKTGRIITGIAAMAACLAIASTSLLNTAQKPYASVYVTINPEVRIDVNRQNIVIGLDGLNEDGDELIEGYSYKKKELDPVMDELVDRAIDMGFLSSGGQIAIALDAEDEEWEITRSDELSHHLNEYLTEKITVTIEIDQPEDHLQPDTPPKIPPTPETDYNISDYGEPVESVTIPVAPVLDEDSGYDDHDDGVTPYDEPEVEIEENDSPYEEPDVEVEDESSPYEEPDVEVGDESSPYEETDDEIEEDSSPYEDDDENDD